MTAASPRRRDATGRVAGLVGAKAKPEQLVEELYLATLGRLPRAEERQRDLAWVQRAPSLREGAQDLLWVLINRREFQFIQ